jgi:hypothetical protein
MTQCGAKRKGVHAKLYRNLTRVRGGIAGVLRNPRIISERGTATDVLVSGCVRIFGITRAGLASLAIGVLVLWGCFASEMMATRRAQAELRASLRQIERLRQSVQPVSRPSVNPFVRPSAV